MSCRDKVKDRCGVKTPAKCVQIDNKINSYFPISEDKCLDVDTAIHTAFSEIKNLSDKTKIELNDNNCLGLKRDANINEVVKKLTDVVCSTNKNTTNSFGNFDISGLGLDFKCLQAPCDRTHIGTLKDLLQAIINKVCNE